MIYKKFNKYIYEHFFNSENFGETIIMAVDESMMKDFCEKHQTSKKDLKEEIREKFRYNWGSSFTKKKNIPKFLGLIAVQIHEASLMQNEKNKFTAREYNPRLEKYLNVSQSQLQILYANYQDKLWHKLETWADEKGFNVCIPEIGFGPGRYTQYPLSQALLNQEDLKQIPLLFQNAGLKPDEYLSFKSFIKLIKDSDYNIGLPSHYYRIKWRLQEQDKEHLLYQQLFGYFNEKWDGTYPGEIEKNTNKQNLIEKNRTNLTIDNDLKTISIIQEFDCLYKYSLENANLFKIIREYYNPFYKEIFFFKQDSFYDEWIDCRYLETQHEHIIICKKNSRAESFIHNLDSNHTRIELKHCFVFKVRIGEKRSKHFYWNLFFNAQPKNYAFEGGLKLSRKTWMHGAGPNIIFFEKTDAWINGKRISFEDNNLEISCRKFEAGTYRLKVKDYSPEKIEIKEPNYIPQTVNLGWKIDRKNLGWKIAQEDYQISGLSTCFPKIHEKASVQTWRAALVTKSNNQINSSVTINAIKRAKYGITKSNN